jgi:hypothetical protein
VTPPYPEVELILTVGSWSAAVEAYLDTGFDGGLAIPVGAAREILAEPYRTSLRMADDDIERAPAWYGAVEVSERVFRCEVVALGSRYLLGREVLDQMEVCFEFGQAVRLGFRDDLAP